MNKRVFISSLFLSLFFLLFSHTIARADTLIFSDSFTDTDDTLIENHDTHYTPYGETRIQNNKLFGVSPTGWTTYNDFYDTGNACLSLDVDFPMPSGVDPIHMSVMGRQDDPATYNYGMYIGADVGGLYGNSEYITESGGAVPLPNLPSGTHTLMLCGVDTDSYGYVDGIQVMHGHMDDPNRPMGGTFGFIIPPGVTADNLQYTGTVTKNLTAAGPVNVWVNRRLLDIGVKFDLKAEVYKDTTLVTSGELNSVTPTVNPALFTIPTSSFSPVDLPSDSVLDVRVYARTACTGSLRNAGQATLSYNSSATDSKFDATIGQDNTTYHLSDSFALTPAVGTSQKSVVVATGAKCSPFKSFGSWKKTITY